MKKILLYSMILISAFSGSFALKASAFLRVEYSPVSVGLEGLKRQVLAHSERKKKSALEKKLTRIKKDLAQAITDKNYEKTGQLLAIAERIYNNNPDFLNPDFGTWLNSEIRSTGRTLLHHAVTASAKAKLISLLFEFGAKEVADKKGTYPSQLVQTNNVEVRDCFAKHGVKFSKAQSNPRKGKNAAKKRVKRLKYLSKKS